MSSHPPEDISNEDRTTNLSATLREGESPPPLAHRTDRFAFRNARTPVVFVDDDPFFFLATNSESISDNPFKRNVADIRHQYYIVEAEGVEESERVIRELIEKFDADDEQQFYYTLAGTRAQISGNGLDDYFDAIGNFSTSYRDLEEQLEPADDRQPPGFPHGPMRVRCIGLTYVNGFWLRFTVWLTEDDERELYSHTSLALTSLEQHGPLTAIWLQDRLDHPAVGEPSAVDRQRQDEHTSLSLGPDPLMNVKQHRLIGYRGRDEATEYISATNPFYRSDRDERREVFHDLDGAGVPNDLAAQLPAIDRLPFRPRGGSIGIEKDVFVNAELTLSQFGKGSSGLILLSGKVNPVEEEEYEAQISRRTRLAKERGSGLLSRLTRS